MKKKIFMWGTVIVIAFIGAFLLWGVIAPDASCADGSRPDRNGCCGGETYTDMGAEIGFVCCPQSGDCFPPIK